MDPTEQNLPGNAGDEGGEEIDTPQGGVQGQTGSDTPTETQGTESSTSAIPSAVPSSCSVPESSSAPRRRGERQAATAPRDNEEERDLITVTPDGEFIPLRPRDRMEDHSDVVAEITDIIKKRFKAAGPWTCWDEMWANPTPLPPGETLDSVFPAPGDGARAWMEFRQRFTWELRDDKMMAKAFIKAGRSRFSDTLFKVKRKRPKCPDWFERSWGRMNRYWNNDEAFKKRSKQCSDNRKLGPPMTHGQGSRSGFDVRKKMTKESDGVEPTQLEWLERSKTSKKRKEVDPYWAPIIEGIREKTIGKHGHDRSNHPLRPTPETYPAPNEKNRIPGHSGVSPAVFGFQSKKRYSIAGVLEREKTAEEINAEKIKEVANDCVFQMLGQFPGFRDLWRVNFVARFGREPAEAEYPQFDAPQWNPPAGAQAPPPAPQDPPAPTQTMEEDPSQYLNEDEGMDD